MKLVKPNALFISSGLPLGRKIIKVFLKLILHTLLPENNFLSRSTQSRRT